MDTRAISNRYLVNYHDLGRIDDPILVCGGAYSNLEALEALLEAANRHGISGNRIIHTGDAVAYCADPARTSALLRESQVHAIQGNVEESLSLAAPDCGCGFDAGSPCEKLSAEWFAYADHEITDELRQWMGRLPFQLTFSLGGRRARVIHGGATEINRFLFASTPAETLTGEFAAAGADVIIAGHSGLPFTRTLGHRVWHNSGALGMPANDGTPRVWYSVITPGKDGLHFSHHELHYDHEKARAKMAAARLPAEYAEALVTGLWPSLDVLPDPERSRTGQPLDGSEIDVDATDVAVAI